MLLMLKNSSSFFGDMFSFFSYKKINAWLFILDYVCSYNILSLFLNISTFGLESKLNHHFIGNKQQKRQYYFFLL